MCERPSKILGLSIIKGTLEKGKQADIVVFDPDYEKEITEADIYSRFKEVSIYKGKTLKGRVKSTYLRGQ